MTASIILLDLPSGNVMTDFATEREAWDALRSWARDEGVEAITDLSLLSIQDGEPTVIAMEDDLVQRVAHELGQGADLSESRR
jgi:hypothetical protein